MLLNYLVFHCGGGAMVARRTHNPKTRFKSYVRNHKSIALFYTELQIWWKDFMVDSFKEKDTFKWREENL